MNPELGASRILVVDDDIQLRELLVQMLRDEGYRVSGAGSTVAMRAELAREAFDLVLLDLMLPGEDGLSALQSDGEKLPPVIMMSAYGTLDQRVLGLDTGAEDFVQKPCPPEELLARIRRALRRAPGGAPQADTGPAAPQRIQYGFASWVLDATSRTLFDPAGVVIDLSSREYALLLALVRNPQRILARDDLLALAQGDESEVFDRAIDVQVSRLRKKLAGRAGSMDLIRTHRGQGYEFTQAVTPL